MDCNDDNHDRDNYCDKINKKNRQCSQCTLSQCTASDINYDSSQICKLIIYKYVYIFCIILSWNQIILRAYDNLHLIINCNLKSQFSQITFFYYFILFYYSRVPIVVCMRVVWLLFVQVITYLSLRFLLCQHLLEFFILLESKSPKPSAWLYKR